MDVSFTSPPYNRIRNDTYEFYDDNKCDYYELLCGVTDELLRVTKRTVIVNIQQNRFNKNEVFSYIGKYGNDITGIVVWTKDNPQPSTNFDGETRSITNAFEYFFVMQKDGRFRAYGEEQTLNHIRSSVNSEHFEGHGAVMKLDVAKWFIEKFTKPGFLVLDPFMGIGTTAVACELLGRRWMGCELVEKYIQMANKRIWEETAQTSMF